MKKMFITALALCLYQINIAHAAPAAPAYDIPGECKNLALMQAQLITTQFHVDNGFGNGTYNPSSLTLKTNNGLTVKQLEYLGGDSEDESGPLAGKYPCDLDTSLCTHPADAGGPIDWARVTINSGDYPVAQVVVSMGGRGGCTISSSKYVQ